MTDPREIPARAVSYSAYGGEDVIITKVRPVRAPGANEVRVKVVTAAVSPTDILMRDPGYGDLTGPMIPGMDLAGVVESIGDGVVDLRAGDRVMAAVTPLRPDGGAQAEYVVIPAASAVTIPATLSFAEASTLPMNGLTALYALRTANLEPGETVATPGGAGWLGRLAIAFAKAQGLRVISDARPAEIDLVRAFGADIVVERSDDFAAAVRAVEPDGVAAFIDTAVLKDSAFPAIRDGGVYIPLRGWSGPAAPRDICIAPIFVYDVFDRTDWLSVIRDAALSGVITPLVEGEYAPEHVGEAQRRLSAGGVRGRPVIRFAEG